CVSSQGKVGAASVNKKNSESSFVKNKSVKNSFDRNTVLHNTVIIVTARLGRHNIIKRPILESMACEKEHNNNRLVYFSSTSLFYYFLNVFINLVGTFRIVNNSDIPETHSF